MHILKIHLGEKARVKSYKHALCVTKVSSALVMVQCQPILYMLHNLHFSSNPHTHLSRAEPAVYEFI